MPKPRLEPTTAEQKESRGASWGVENAHAYSPRTWAVSAGMGNAWLGVGNILIHSRVRDAFISSFICFVFIELVSCFEAQTSLALHCFSASAPSTEIIGLCVPHPDIPMSPVSAVCKPQHSRLLYSAQLSSSSTGIALSDFKLTSTRSTHSGPAPPPVCPMTLLSRFFHRKPFTFWVSKMLRATHLRRGRTVLHVSVCLC